jgi:hypothetical protein
MRLERAHAQLLSQNKGLAVMGFGWADTREIAAHGNVAEETAHMRLVAAPCVSAGEFAEASSEHARLVHAADEQACLAQLGEHELMMGGQGAPGGNALQRLV